MAVKAGQIIHVGNGTVLVDRVQTGGPGQLNIPTEKIYELGNYKSVGTIRDTPDLTFNLESFDVSTEVETMLAGAYAGRSVADGVTNGTATVTSATAAFTSADVGRMVIIPTGNSATADYVGTISAVGSATSITVSPAVTGTGTGKTLRIVPNGIDLATAVPVDVASQWKPGESATTPFDVVTSVAIPFLYVESMSYRFGYRDNATQSASLRGDSIFYNPGPCYVQTAAGTNSAGQTIVTANPAYQSADGDGRRVLSVEVDRKRLTFGVDYTESYGAVTNGAAVTTVTLTAAYGAVPTTSTIRIMYASPTALTYNQGVHPSSTVRPAAVRGKDIDIYLGTAGSSYNPNDLPGSQQYKLKTVQSVNVDWRANIEKDEEFGNYFATGVDFDVPVVSGSVEFRPSDPADLQALLRRITGITDVYKVLGPNTAVPLVLDVVIKDGATGKPLKRLNVSDARFTLPGYQGQVQQKVNVTANFESDEGNLKIYEY